MQAQERWFNFKPERLSHEKLWQVTEASTAVLEVRVGNESSDQITQFPAWELKSNLIWDIQSPNRDSAYYK